MTRFHVTFKGQNYDITIDGDDIDEIKNEYEKVKDALGRVAASSSLDQSRKPRVIQPVKESQPLFRGPLNQRIMQLVTENFFKREQEGICC